MSSSQNQTNQQLDYGRHALLVLKRLTHRPIHFVLWGIFGAVSGAWFGFVVGMAASRYAMNGGVWGAVVGAVIGVVLFVGCVELHGRSALSTYNSLIAKKQMDIVECIQSEVGSVNFAAFVEWIVRDKCHQRRLKIILTQTGNFPMATFNGTIA